MKPMFRGNGFTEQFDFQKHGRKEHRRCWVLMVDESNTEDLPAVERKTIIAITG